MKTVHELEMFTNLGAGVWKLDVRQFTFKARVYQEHNEDAAFLKAAMSKGLLQPADTENGR